MHIVYSGYHIVVPGNSSIQWNVLIVEEWKRMSDST